MQRLQKKEEGLKRGIQKEEIQLTEMETEQYTDLPDPPMFWEACKLHELNQEAVDTFIKKVKIRDAQKIEIIWNFSDGKKF
jgi:hypothetical protein